MPNAPMHNCVPGCSALLPHGVKRCSIHAPNTSHGWRNDDTRIRGRKLQRLRNELFTREPLCRECAKHDRTTIATIRDHIVPLAEGGTDAPENIQPLCQSCSDAKTRAEARRGRR